MSPPRTLAVIALSLAALRPAWAQETHPKDPKQDTPAAAPAEDAAKALARLAELYPRVRQKPAENEIAVTTDPKARAEAVKRMEAWRSDVDRMNEAADAYARALGDAAPDADGLYYRGYAKAVGVQFSSTAQVRAMCDAGADALGRYLSVADEKSAFRTDAEMHLGSVLLLAGRLDEALPHLQRGVELLQKESRHDDAGRCAADGLKTLRATHRDEDFRKFADAIHAADGDFGVLTRVVREHVAAFRFSVGAPLPELPETKDVDGKPVSWRPGKPMLLHFFLTAHITGDATNFREIELEIRPLREKYREKGLAVVGVSMDNELPAAEVERKRKQNEEWGVKKEIRDGSLASVREWAVRQGIDWPWCWDGKAWNCPLSVALGGVARSQPFAVLVDKDGIVRWKGDAPFQGLPEAVAKLLP